MLKDMFGKIFSSNIESPFTGTGDTTIERLKSGNEHFTSYMLMKSPISNISKVKQLAVYGQNPSAVIVTCSDARISPERIFCAEMGDFFIIRTAGNVVGDLELGSIEYAVEEIMVDTVIVMGHESCGAIQSATSLRSGHVGNIQSILDEVEPSIQKAKEGMKNRTDFLVKAENYNILNTLEKIKGSEIVQKAIENGRLTVVASKYGIADGKVTFFDENFKF